MRIIFTIISVISSLLIAPLTLAAESQTIIAPKPTAESVMMTPNNKVPDKGMMSNNSEMMNWNNQYPSMMGIGKTMPHYFNYKTGYSPWESVICAITIGLVWILLGSIIFALWAWIKKQK